MVAAFVSFIFFYIDVFALFSQGDPASKSVTVQLPLTDQALQQKWQLKRLRQTIKHRGTYNDQLLSIYVKSLSQKGKKKKSVTA